MNVRYEPSHSQNRNVNEETLQCSLKKKALFGIFMCKNSIVEWHCTALTNNNQSQNSTQQYCTSADFKQYGQDSSLLFFGV